MTQSNTDVLYDTRLIQRNLQKGLLTPKQLEAWVAGLADLSSQSDPLVLGFTAGSAAESNANHVDAG